MADVTVAPAASIQGQIELPGDKSVSHRALMVAALATREVQVANLALSEDVRSTIGALRSLGVEITHDADDATIVTVGGVGMRGLREPADGAPIECGNAGTLARLLPGLLAGQPEGVFTLVGDESLSRRPMRRIAGPLGAMGIDIQTADEGTLPMTIEAGAPITGIDLDLDVASAQVQSAVLFAGLYGDEKTSVTEPARIRDHTARMLKAAGVKVRRSGLTVTVHPADAVELPDYQVPADPSSAAFFVVAATLLRDSLVRMPGVLVSPGRSGLLDVLERMRGQVATLGRRERAGEQIADLEVTPAAQLVRTPLQRDEVPATIDELPLFALLAHFCKGPSVVKGAGELRHKESDRIESLVTNLRRLGVSIDELAEGFVVKGSGTRLAGGSINADGDHRIAMLGGIAGLVSRTGVTIHGAECADVSYPGFFDVLEQMAVRN